MKKFFRTIHLYLGLAAGLVIALVCLTGALLAFEKEIQISIYPQRYTVSIPGNEKMVSLDAMANAVHAKLPKAKIRSLKVYADKSRTVEVMYSEQKKTETGTKRRGKGGNSIAFVNPYSGEVVSLYNQRKSFFFTVLSLHRWLLAEDTGKLIVGCSTFIFLFIIITGIILWWPKTRKAIKQRLKIKFSGSWKRLNHDLHIVLGFYTAIFLFASAFTGLAWSFQWFNDGIYKLTGTEKKMPEAPKSESIAYEKPVSFDQVYAIAKSSSPGAEYYTFNSPKDSASAYVVNVLPDDAVHERATDQLYVDQYSGKLLGSLPYQQRNLGQRIRSTFYPVHVGSIGGLAGRIITCFACICGFTFLFTGLIIWINRIRKRKKKKRKEAIPA